MVEVASFVVEVVKLASLEVAEADSGAWFASAEAREACSGVQGEGIPATTAVPCSVGGWEEGTVLLRGDASDGWAVPKGSVVVEEAASGEEAYFAAAVGFEVVEEDCVGVEKLAFGEAQGWAFAFEKNVVGEDGVVETEEEAAGKVVAWVRELVFVRALADMPSGGVDCSALASADENVGRSAAG